jgi:hypothetical protein
MFGKHFEAAEATVVFIEMRSHGLPKSLYELILDVRTQDGQTFRTSIKEHFVPFLDPSVGDVVKVQYDPMQKYLAYNWKRIISCAANCCSAVPKAPQLS